MNAQFGDGPKTGGSLGASASWVRRTLGVGVLALLLVSTCIGQARACFSDSCVSVEKYVSVQGVGGPFIKNSVTTIDPMTGFPVGSVPGQNNTPDSSVTIPTDFFNDNTKVVYQFVIRNCGSRTLYDVRVLDCIDARSVGEDAFLVGNSLQCGSRLIPEYRGVASILQPGQTVIVNSASPIFQLDPISTVDVCDTFGHSRTNGMVRNDIEVRADAYKDGEGKTCVSQDLNLVKCEEFIPTTAKLGDRVWKDLNGDGIQNCVDTNGDGILGNPGDVGPECTTGVPNVKVDLVNCDTSAVLKTTTTDQYGLYLFDNLNPGTYCVKFNLDTVPQGTCGSGLLPQFTAQHVGTNPAVDSDANPVTGISTPVTLTSGETNRTVDAGILCKSCPVTVDKKCQVQQAPPTSSFVCSNAKPIDSLTMIWDGQDGIFIKAWKGLPGTILLATKGPINHGDTVTVTGMGGSPLDQFWEIFSGFPNATNKIGESDFHISCSDVDMNGPEDCGKFEGNAKTTSTTLINTWIFEGMAGNGQALVCTPQSPTGEDACSFAAQSASCQSLGAKPKTLVFEYTGSDCSASKNSQAPDKWFCTGVPGSNPTISIITDPTKITVSPTTGIQVGDLITVSAIGSDMGTEIQLQIGGQTVKIHTSCSQPLATGDVFGSLQLVQFNGQGGSSQVTYLYEVKNNGTDVLDITSVFDNKLGELLSQPATLLPGTSIGLQKTAMISETTTNVVTATARFNATKAACGQASDQLTVTVTQPTCDVSAIFYALSDTSATFKLTNTSKLTATMDTFVLNFPLSYGAIKEIRLNGASIYKSSATVPFVGSGVTISGTDWTNLDVTKRRVAPGATLPLQILFTNHGLVTGWTSISDLGGVTFQEGCAVAFPHK